MKETIKKPLTVFKITTRGNLTRPGCFNQTKWDVGVVHSSDGLAKDLCNPSWLHCYPHPVLAFVCDPIHGNFLTNTKSPPKPNLGKAEIPAGFSI